MGKDKQRTKGGVKPTSSGRTAELLFKTPNVGFGGEFASYVPIIGFGLADFDSASSTLSPDVRLLLRKLSKKDATTKLKALAELSELFALNADDVCNEVLPYWPRLYSKLAVDDSRKVREVCHGVLEVLGKQVGRNLAPHLKSIAPYWYLGQHDIFAPAASAATRSFTSVFSTEKKQKEAISFCRDEIFGLISENLTSPAKKQEKKEGGDELDSEPYDLRMAFASLSGLTKLIDSDVVEEAQLQSVLDTPEFWGLTKHLSCAVRRELFNLVTMVANKKPALIQRQCIKAITQSLREETSECLQSLWNCFLTLTLNCDAFTSDPNLTKSQLLKVCRKGFYGNATSLGPAVLPLVAKIGIDEEFVRQLLQALQAGYAAEKSISEKSAILRAYAEALAYFIGKSSTDVSALLNEVVFPSLELLIREGSATDFGQTLGQLIKKEEFFLSLSDFITKNIETLNGRNLGSFVASICANKQPETLRKSKSVKFSVDQTVEELSCTSYEVLPDYKKTLVKKVISASLSSAKLDTVMVLSHQFNSPVFYEEATEGKPSMIVDSVAFEKSDDVDAKLSLVLDLIRTFPDVPAFLSKLSSLFESECDKIPKLKVFIEKIRRIKNIPSVTRWLKQDMFCDRIRNLINSCNYSDEDSLTIVRFVLENTSVFSSELVDGVIASLCSHLDSSSETDDRFVKDILRLVTALSEKNAGSKLKAVMSQVWERLVHDLVTATDQEADEHVQYLIDEFVAVAPQSDLTHSELCSTVQKEVDLVTAVASIEKLVKLAHSLVEEIHHTPVFSLRLDPGRAEDLFNLLNLSFFPLKDSSVANHDKVKEQLKPSFLSRSIFEAKFALKSSEDNNDFVNPIVRLLYAQAVCRFWKELDKFELRKSIREEFCSELSVLATRWLEVLAENNWKKWSEEVLDQLTKPQRDVFLTSRLMLNLFLETTTKMELAVSVTKKPLNQFIQDESVSLANENALSFLESLVKDCPLGPTTQDVSLVIDYLNIQRKDFSQFFHFDRIFYHLDVSSKQLLLAVLDVVIAVLRRLKEDDPDEFYSVASCWVSGWLKQCKKLPPELDKSYFLWISKLATATQIIADYARKSPKFASEYVEFHASNLYLPFYYIFLQLGSLGSDELVIVRTTENVGIALSSVPSTTLTFIQPASAQICTSFAPYLESKRASLMITAYRLLRKIKPKPTGSQESDELPIVPVELNEMIRKYGEEISVREISSLDDPDVLTYLLCWDALLTMHADRSCNEFGSFSKEAHLLPQLLSIVFFQLIDLIPEPRFPGYFENKLNLQPDNIPPPFGHLVCSVLLKALQCLPYPTRWWWNSQLSKPRDKTMVEKFISKYLSSKLAAEELGKVQWTDSDNVTVQSHPGCNELIAHYKIEDTTVSLTVTLPLNHPLGPISVKISDKKLLGKISHLLNNKSNSLVAGLQLWKEHLDAKYSGHEECAICFFILHSSTKSLPKLACKTCNHKFHSACLLKWFSTSNKSECPLCRNLF